MGVELNRFVVRDSSVLTLHEAIRKLVSLMRSKETSQLTQFYAAQELLNRGHGRPATAVTRGGRHGAGAGRTDRRSRVLPMTGLFKTYAMRTPPSRRFRAFCSSASFSASARVTQRRPYRRSRSR
jgi:hypothetical protein